MNTYQTGLFAAYLLVIQLALGPALVARQTAATPRRTEATRLVCFAFPCAWSSEVSMLTLTSRGELKGQSGTVAVASRLPVPKDFEITRVFSAPFDGDVLVAYELEDGEVGTARIVRLNGRSLIPRWVVEIKGFNLSEGSLEGYLYQGALGIVARINLRRGTFVWKHENLYDRTRGVFSAFARPVVGPVDVEFEDAPTIGPSRARVRVNKRTGQLSVH